MRNGSTERHIELAKQAVSHLQKRYEETQGETGDYGPLEYQPFIDLMADDVVFEVPCPPGTPYFGEPIRGKDAVVNLLLVDDRETIDWLEVVKPLEYFGDGERVVVLTAYTYKIKKTGVLARNKDIALVLNFRDDVITRALEIQDLSEWVVAYQAA